MSQQKMRCGKSLYRNLRIKAGLGLTALRNKLWVGWRKLNWPWKGLLLIAWLVLVIRFLPYFAPIQATELIQNQQAIEFQDRNGLRLGTVLTRDQEHTAAVSLHQVSPHFIQAILAAEDQRFYQHGALDGRAIGRALLEAAQARRIVSGASTITMQLARMIHPTPSTLPGKLAEIWTSWRLAAGMNRDEILQAYMNRLPMGGNIYGVEAASRLYFGVSASELNVAQASLLAAIPNDPNRLNPYEHWQALKKRQAYVLKRMVADRYLTAAAADRVTQEEVALQSRQQGIVAAPHFLFWLANQLSDYSTQVQTTLDLPLQQFVETQMQQVLRSLAPNHVQHAAALVLDNHSGEVLAYVGSPDYFADNQLGRNDGVQALRQPGSTLKPFLYELALEKRVIHPNTVLADVPTRYAIPGAKLYTPSDYSETFQGPVRIRVALANSLNVPAVRVLEKVGVPVFLDRLRELGFRHLTRSPDYYGLGLTLGSGEVSLWELAQAYLAMARQGEGLGVRCQVSGVRCQERERKEQGAVGKREDAEIQSSIFHSQSSPVTWSLITDMLSDSHARAKAFGVDSLLSLPFPAAVKTGTSSDFRDTWTVGFTPDYTVAAWVGNFDGSPMRQVSGVTGAAPLWNRILLHLHEQKEPQAFPPPAGLVKRPICALSGARPTPACPTIVQEYFYPQDLAEYDREPDPFYQMTTRNGRLQTHLKLPAEYNEWLATQPPLLTEGQLRILSPQNGDSFLLDKSTHAEATTQKLEFKLANPIGKPVEWQLNGQAIATQASNSLFWIPKPGNWTLRVQSGNMSDQVKFQVQIAETHPTRRGFSVAKPSN